MHRLYTLPVSLLAKSALWEISELQNRYMNALRQTKSHLFVVDLFPGPPTTPAVTGALGTFPSGLSAERWLPGPKIMSVQLRGGQGMWGDYLHIAILGPLASLYDMGNSNPMAALGTKKRPEGLSYLWFCNYSSNPGLIKPFAVSLGGTNQVSYYT